MAPLLYALFFVSGVSALVFEMLWFRQAGLTLGNSVWASSLVLSGFMGGLALGNLAAARYGARVPNAVRAYGIAEAVIAVTGIALVVGLPALGAAIAPWLGRWLDVPWVINPIRLLIAFVLLLVPATAMGVTLPLLTSALAGSGSPFGSILGRLYGLNTLGAVVGVVLTETHLVAAFGVRGTAFVAGGLSMGAAVVALRAGRFAAGANGPAKAGHHVRSSAEGVHHVLSGRAAAAARADGIATHRLLTAAFLSGFCVLALEVVWFRFLLLFIKGHALALALMLALVLAGIALGGLLASAWLRAAPRSRGFAAAIALAAGFTCAASYALAPALVAASPPLVVDAAAILRLAGPLTAPVSLLSGVLFTMLGAALRERGSSEAETTGRLTLANTAGAAIGAIAGGLLLLPLLGIEKSWFAIALLYGASGLLLMPGTGTRMASGSAAVLCAVGLALFPFGSLEERFLQRSVTQWLQTGEDARIVEVREGLTETIIYFERLMLGKPVSHAMLTNAYSMSATGYGARRYMKLYAYWPLAVHPDAKRALLIGYGVGNTAKALTDSKQLQSIDVVDLSRDILDLNRIVYPRAADLPLNDPRVRVHIEDGRYLLRATDESYDLITGEPPPPGISGVEHLYTLEYFQLIHDRLADGGIVTYWLPLSDLTDVSAKAILRAFCDVFDDCSLWNGSGTNLMMIGTRAASTSVPEAMFTRQWKDPVVAPEMRRLGLEQPEQLGALFIGDRPYLERIVADASPLEDNHPKLIEAAFSSPDAGERLLHSFTDTAAAKNRFAASELIRRLWPASLAAASLPYFDVQDAINSHMYGNLLQRPDAIREVHHVLTSSSLAAPVLWRLGSNADVQRIVEMATPDERRGPMMQFHIGVRLLSERRYPEAAEAFSQSALLAGELAASAASTGNNAFALQIYALCMAGQTSRAQELIRGPWVQSLRDRGVNESSMRDAPLPPFWVWMKETFGVDPRL